MVRNNFTKNTLATALGACILSMLPINGAFAASNDGALIGRLTAPIAGSAVTAKNLDTGLERTVTADAQGNFRFPFLPVGDYSLTLTQGGQTVQKIERVRVSLGNATTVNLGASEIGRASCRERVLMPV